VANDRSEVGADWRQTVGGVLCLPLGGIAIYNSRGRPYLLVSGLVLLLLGVVLVLASVGLFRELPGHRPKLIMTVGDGEPWDNDIKWFKRVKVHNVGRVKATGCRVQQIGPGKDDPELRWKDTDARERDLEPDEHDFLPLKLPHELATYDITLKAWHDVCKRPATLRCQLERIAPDEVPVRSATKPRPSK
jgi:hypothetical protein